MPKGPTLHGLRHANGSALILAGIPITQVAAHLGDDVQTLVAVYAHELDSPMRQRIVAAAVEGLYSAPATATEPVATGKARAP